MRKILLIRGRKLTVANPSSGEAFGAVRTQDLVVSLLLARECDRTIVALPTYCHLPLLLGSSQDPHGLSNAEKW